MKETPNSPGHRLVALERDDELWVWKSYKACVKHTGLSLQEVSSLVAGKRKSAKGWRSPYMEPKINYIVIVETPSHTLDGSSLVAEVSVETNVISALELAYELNETKSAHDDSYYFVEARYA